MKHFKKMMALIIALVMVVGTMSIAANAAPGDFSSTPEKTIEVTDLVSGDGAKYIQILKEDPNVEGGWNWADAVASVLQGTAPNKTLGGLSVADITKKDTNGVYITDAEAAKIANAVKNLTFQTMTVSGTTATASNVNPGLYYVAVTPGDTNDNIYNPIFVSADYYEGGNTISTSDKYASRVIAKSQPVDVIKDYEDKSYKDVAPGDEIEFTVTTNIPSYTDAYEKKEFYLTDILTSGLELKATTVAVAVEGYTLTSGTDYIIRENKDIDENEINGYSVEFQKAFLDVVLGNPKVTVTYTAIVKEDAAKGNVTEMDNEITLTYTHKFDGTPNEITKKTRHYTFGIDASLLGETGSYELENTEDFVKVGVDENNKPIIVSHVTDYRRIDHDETTVAALNGATFKLEAYSGDCTSSDKKEWDITTNGLGELSVTGLDAGIYKLTELTAPGGFIPDKTPRYIQIDPHYENDEYGIPYLTGYDILWGTDPADLHVVKSYQMTNDNHDKTLTGIKTSHIKGSDTQLNNTQGLELPSTGGIGTTIFYIVGAILVVGAGVLLVTRRRMNANE